MVPSDVAEFGRCVAARLQDELSSELVGVYFVGSVALGGYVAGQSDVDIAAVSAHRISDQRKRSIACALLETVGSCPARGLEFSLYRRGVAAARSVEAGFEVNVNGGPAMPHVVRVDARNQPGFWYILDRAIAHLYGVAIIGPPAAEVFEEVPGRILLDAMVASMRWHRRHERATLYSVLNASRAWRYAAEGILDSKMEGAAWARSRWIHPALIDAAVELRKGGEASLDEKQVDEFLGHVERVLVDRLGG